MQSVEDAAAIARKTRFAPSPSGRMHLGNMFSALLVWLHARSCGGEVLLRLEDLDERCASQEASQMLLDDLSWLGLDFDAAPYFQSSSLARYDEALERISARGELYPCFCSRADLHVASAPHTSDGAPVYPATCYGLGASAIEQRLHDKPPALRLHVPDRTYTFEDGHQGLFSQNLRIDCGDFVLRRSDGVYAYQLVCVVDDIEQGIDDVVRGRDLLSSAPRQMYLYELLGSKPCSYWHHPLLLAPDGRRLSKRDKDCDMGYIRAHVKGPEHLVGFLAKLAGLLETATPCTPEELVPIFSWGKIAVDDLIVGPIQLVQLFS